MAVGPGGKEKKQADAVGQASVLTFKGRRWTVGTMVVVSIIFAAGLTVLLQFITFNAQRPLKWDLTSSGINSLNAGTRSVLDSLGEKKVYLTSLYMETDIESEAQRKYRKAVNDLLRLYQAERPANVEIDWINPLKDQPKLGVLLKRVRGRERFKAETEPHVAAIDRFEKEILEPFKTLLLDFVEQLDSIDQAAAMGGGDPIITRIVGTLNTWTGKGAEVLKDLQTVRAQPMPRYSAATVSLTNFYDRVGSEINVVINTWAVQQLRGNQLTDSVKDVVSAMKDELQPWIDRFEDEKQKIQDLPSLAMDELERALQQNNTVVVETSDGAKAVPFEDMWPPLREGSFARPDEFDKRRFAGEGSITPAILQLIQKQRTALVFVRHAGPQLFGFRGFGPTAQRGAHNALKAELEKLNYTVTEWNVKQTQAKPTFDTEPKRTIYIVLRPGPSLNPQGLPTVQGMGPLERAAVLNAVGESGRALFLTGWEFLAPAYAYDEFLSKKWGIDVDGASMVITATPIGPGEWGLARGADSVKRVKFLKHELTEGLESLQEQCEFPWTTTMSIADEKPEDVDIRELAIVPASEDVWGVKDPPGFFDRYQNEGKTRMTADDLAGPFPVALAASKGDDKIVVFASGHRMISDAAAVSNVLVIGADGRLTVRRRAPGNLALFLNVLHYLDDTLQWLNIGSPIDSSRIEITERQLTFWRVLAVGVFPAFALLGGGLVWFIRRR